MNSRLLAGLAVVVALASAMTFVGLYSSNAQQKAESKTTSSTSQFPSAQSVVPSDEATQGSASVETSVTVGGTPVSTSVTVR